MDCWVGTSKGIVISAVHFTTRITMTTMHHIMGEGIERLGWELTSVQFKGDLTLAVNPEAPIKFSV
eukprot:scaffold51756_cov15-Tisochrysis_lutea.AAC.2